MGGVVLKHVTSFGSDLRMLQLTELYQLQKHDGTTL